MYQEIIVGKNKAGKKLAYIVKPNESLRTIYFVGGGQLPKELEGGWTDVRQIEAAIAVYLNKDTLCAPDQEKKDFKTSVSASKKRPSKLKLKEA